MNYLHGFSLPEAVDLKMVLDRFRVSKYDHLPDSDLVPLIAFLKSRIFYSPNIDKIGLEAPSYKNKGCIFIECDGPVAQNFSMYMCTQWSEQLLKDFAGNYIGVDNFAHTFFYNTEEALYIDRGYEECFPKNIDELLYKKVVYIEKLGEYIYEKDI